MQKDSEQDMKNMVESIITNLGQKGIKVESAAILKIENGNDQQIENVIKEAFNKARKTVNPLNKPRGETKKLGTGDQKPYGPDSPCFCPNCFRFDNFEEILKPLGGDFDYISFSLLGKQFDLKFHRDKEGRENLMIQETQPDIKAPVIDPAWTTEEIQKALNEAIARKDFDVAQKLFDQLNNRKNQ